MDVKRNPELEALFARLPLLDRGELLALAGARQPDDPARETAWTSVRDAITASHAEGELERCVRRSGRGRPTSGRSRDRRRGAA